MTNDASSNPRRKLIISISLVLVIIITVVVTYLTYSLSMGSGQKAFYARSMDDASYDCEAKIIDRFDERLINKHFDQYSSRYDANKRQYLIYYRVTASDNGEDVPTLKEHMVKCVVWERLGYVSDFSVFDDF